MFFQKIIFIRILKVFHPWGPRGGPWDPRGVSPWDPMGASRQMGLKDPGPGAQGLKDLGPGALGLKADGPQGPGAQGPGGPGLNKKTKRFQNSMLQMRFQKFILKSDV